MDGSRRFTLGAIGLLLGGCTLLVLAQPPTELPTAPLENAGQDVTGALEGWFKNPDGTFSLLVGYFNRNLEAGAGYSDRRQ